MQRRRNVPGQSVPAAFFAAETRPSTLAEIAYDCGYFDQAHMNRDFRELAGTTPSGLLVRRSAAGGVAA